MYYISGAYSKHKKVIDQLSITITPEGISVVKVLKKSRKKQYILNYFRANVAIKEAARKYCSD